MKLSLITLTITHAGLARSSLSETTHLFPQERSRGLKHVSRVAVTSPEVSGCHDISFLPCYITRRLLFLLFF